MIHSLWQRLFSSSSPEERAYARSLYLAIARQSRQPFFYTECKIPDTLQGRFEVLAIHLFLCLHRLKGKQEISRALMEYFVDDMDRSIREMGAGDTGVGKRVRVMAEAFFGRRQAYGQALGNHAALTDALIRNVYATADDIKNEQAEQLANYMEKALASLGTQPAEQLDLAAITAHQPPPQKAAQG